MNPMQRILLTGANGFVGRNLEEQLRHGCHLYTPSRAELNLLDTEGVERYIRKNQITSVIHSAIHVPMFHGAENETEHDLRMFFNLYRLSAYLDKIIYFGSGAEYNKRLDISMAREEDIGDTIPESHYGLAKYAMNQVARGSENCYNLRLFGIFGKYELWSIKFISNLCCKAVFGFPLSIRQNCLFDFLFIKDLGAIVNWFLEHQPAYHDYNVCYGTPFLLSELAELVCEVSGKNLPIQIMKSGRNLDYSGSNQRLRWQIPELKLTGMRDAIADLYGYYERHQKEIDPDVLRETK